MNQKDRRSGVAVIIVLGLLSLLMVLGVAFSTTMRVERFGAGNYARDAQTKQVIWMALARAIAQLDDDIGNDIYPTWSDDIRVSGTGGVVNLAYGEALEYVPGILRDFTTGTKSAWTNVETAWCAYMIINCSDMLDANYVGGETREGGRSPGEIQLTNPPLSPGFLTPDEMTKFEDDRRGDIRYESIPELLEMNSGIESNEIFTAYSRYPLGVLEKKGNDYTIFSDVVDIGVDHSDLEDDRAEIEQNFGLALFHGVPLAGSDASYLFDALVDYVDPDCEPRNLMSPCMESVPMINEVHLSNLVIGRASMTDSTIYGFGGHLQIETFYPFVKPSEHQFTVTGNVQIVVSGAPSGASVVSNIPLDVYSGYVPGDVEVHRSAAGPPDGPGAANTPIGIPFFQADKNDALTVSISISDLTVIVNNPAHGDHGKIVDRMGGALTFTYPPAGPFDTSGAGMAAQLTEQPSREAVDPRFNWNAASHFMPCQAGNTTYTTNWNTSMLLAARDTQAGRIEKGSRMYVADRGHLESVGELGHLPRSMNMPFGAWQTIRLVDQRAAGNNNIAPRDKVYKYFTVHSNSVARGLVNLNTPDLEILETAFAGMPVPFADSATTIHPRDMDAILDEIDSYAQRTVFTNVDDLAEIDWRGAVPDGRPPFANRSDLEIEAMIAHSAGLLGTRQNLFLIILAEGIDTGGVGVSPGTEMLIGRRAIAQVWRDPFPDEDGMHPCFVRYFKWLDD